MKITGYETDRGNVTAITVTDETRGFYDKRFEAMEIGEWFIRGDNTFITCSKCGYVKGVNHPYFRTRFDPLPYYCENCGAKMGGIKK